MCVTNTTYRRAQPVQLQQQQQQSQNATIVSGLTQRLMGTFELSTAPVKPQQQQQQETSFASLYGAVPQLATTNGKPRPKRRRKPQKPGKTAKMNDRHFVVHNYHDHANDTELDYEDTDSSSASHHEETHRKGGVAVAFPLKLHAILDQVERDGLASVISWQPHGRCFVIHQPKIFVESVMPKYFRQTKLTSFQRQLNLYGFCRLTRGPDAGGYYHELFLRGMTFLTKKMIRTKVKGTKFKAASSPEQEPDFYRMPPVVLVTPHQSPMTSPVPPMAATSQELMSNYESAPFPPLYQQQVQQQVVPQQQQAFQFEPVSSTLEPYSFETVAGRMNSADQVLDEAVEEMFLDQCLAEDDLDDFVRDWDPTQPMNLVSSLQNDAQLGYMLDRLLED